MGRTSNAVSQATTRAAAIPTFSISGFGSGYDLYTNQLPELFGVNLVRDMAIMADTDETVGAMLYCINSTMQQISWSFVPQVDGADAPQDPEAKKWADFMSQVLVDLDRPFDEHVEDAMTMLWAGFAPIEMVAKRRDGVVSRFADNLYGLGALNLIDQTTIWDFVYEGDKIVAMRQMAIRNIGSGIIPTSKCALFRTSTQYNNPRGRPLLKPAWRAWRLKRKIQDSEALGIERELCGLPIFEMPEEVISAQFEVDSQGNITDEAKRAQAMVQAAMSATRDMRLNKSGGLVLPSDTYGEEIQGDTTRKYNFRILTSAGTRTIDSRTAARDYDHAIARVAMMQFLTLGQRSGGSYSLSDDQSSMAVASIMALANKVSREWNAKVIPFLWSVNALPAKYRPRMMHSDVNKNGIIQLGQFLAGVGKAADLWAGDIKARESLLKAGNIDFDHDAQAGAAETATAAATAMATAPPPNPGAAPDPED